MKGSTPQKGQLESHSNTAGLGTGQSVRMAALLQGDTAFTHWQTQASQN